MEALKTRSLMLPTSEPTSITFQQGDYNYRTGVITAEGNVILRQGNIQIRADRLRYDQKADKLAVQGNVIWRRGSDVLEADRLSFRASDMTGELFGGKLLLTRDNVYVEGRKFQSFGESKFRLLDGTFTTCDGADPAWKIESKQLDVTVGGYATLKHGFFYVKDVPVLYIPWLIYPFKQKRQTGFLPPTISSSTVRGLDIRFPFFLNIARSADLTLTPRICTNRAGQASAEFRYIPLEDFHGRMYLEYTYDWKYREREAGKSHRFYFTWLHDQDLLDALRLKVNANWISDRDYFEFWGGTFDRRKRARYLESNAVLYKQWDNFLFQAEARYMDNLDLQDNAVTVQNLPSVSGTAFNQKIPYTPVYVSSDLVFDHYFAPKPTDHWLGSRFRMNTRVSLPTNIAGLIKVDPSITYFTKAYAADYYGKDEESLKSYNDLRTDLYELRVDAHTDIHSVLERPFLGFRRIRHAVRPQISWKFRPVTSQQIYPFFDDSDRMDHVSRVDAEIRQTFTGRLGSGRYLDFVRLRLKQGFDFLQAASRARPGQEPIPLRHGWSISEAELALRPHSIVDLTARAQYDPQRNAANMYSFNLGLMDHRGDLFRVLHLFSEDGTSRELNRQTNVNLQLKVTSGLEAFFENQYTHRHDFSFFTSFGLAYHPQCWNVVLKYSETREKDPVSQKIKDPDRTVFMALSLYGLGQVYEMTRDWGTLFGTPTQSIETGG